MVACHLPKLSCRSLPANFLHRQGEPKRAPAAADALHSNPAAMRLNNSFGNVKSEPSSLLGRFLDLPIPLKYVLQMVLRNPRTLICHEKSHPRLSLFDTHFDGA